MLQEGTLMIPLPENMEIVDENGEPIKATGRFYITAETIDLYHLVVDMF